LPDPDELLAEHKIMRRIRCSSDPPFLIPSFAFSILQLINNSSVMSQGTYPYAYEEQPERYRSHQAATIGPTTTHSILPFDQYVTCPSDLTEVEADVGSAFLEIDSELSKPNDL
jgi:hypothetical protein